MASSEDFYKKENVVMLDVKDCDPSEIERFIVTEIEPYLMISIKEKLTEKSLADYAKKLTIRSDGVVLVKQGKIVGIVAGYINNRYVANEVYITLVGVSKFMRRKGCGYILMQEFIKLVPAGLTVWTNCDERNYGVQEFYKSVGFCITNSKEGRLVIKREID